jgi:hypothetical protein
MPPSTIHVTIQYVGSDDYHSDIHGNPPLSEEKRKAMGQFELEPSAADEYALQWNNADVDESRHVRDFGQAELVLRLVRKEDLTKGQ